MEEYLDRLQEFPPVPCEMIFIDESGRGTQCKDKQMFWVTVGVRTRLDDHENITHDLDDLKEKCLKIRQKELKGAKLSKCTLKDGKTLVDIACGLAEIIQKYGITVWVMSTKKINNADKQRFIPSNKNGIVEAKDVSRELLLERISGYADIYHDNHSRYLMIWDIASLEELADFSRIVSQYSNPHSNKRMHPSIIPYILGGLSHEWPELQIADVFSNFALNYSAVQNGILERDDEEGKEKSDIFQKYLWEVLARSSKGIDGIGFKQYRWEEESMKSM